MQQPFRIDPPMPPQAYTSYQVIIPRDTLVPAACEQADCAARRHGWETTVDEATELGARQARYIRVSSGRTFTEQRTAAGLTVFRFEAGQRCFADHKTRPERWLVRGGDHRGNPRGDVREHVRTADWQEDFEEHQDQLTTAIERG